MNLLKFQTILRMLKPGAGWREFGIVAKAVK